MQTAAAASLATARKKPLRYLEMAKTLDDRAAEAAARAALAHAYEALGQKKEAINQLEA